MSLNDQRDSKADKLQAFLTFPIITEAHLGLSKTNCVFSLANAIEFLELCLVDALWRRVYQHWCARACHAGMRNLK
jgi:hypothetical protein